MTPVVNSAGQGRRTRLRPGARRFQVHHRDADVRSGNRQVGFPEIVEFHGQPLLRFDVRSDFDVVDIHHPASGHRGPCVDRKVETERVAGNERKHRYGLAPARRYRGKLERQSLPPLPVYLDRVLQIADRRTGQEVVPLGGLHAAHDTELVADQGEEQHVRPVAVYPETELGRNTFHGRVDRYPDLLVLLPLQCKRPRAAVLLRVHGPGDRSSPGLSVQAQVPAVSLEIRQGLDAIGPRDDDLRFFHRAAPEIRGDNLQAIRRRGGKDLRGRRGQVHAERFHLHRFHLEHFPPPENHLVVPVQQRPVHAHLSRGHAPAVLHGDPRVPRIAIQAVLIVVRDLHGERFRRRLLSLHEDRPQQYGPRGFRFRVLCAPARRRDDKGRQVQREIDRVRRTPRRPGTDAVARQRHLEILPPGEVEAAQLHGRKRALPRIERPAGSGEIQHDRLERRA